MATRTRPGVSGLSLNAPSSTIAHIEKGTLMTGFHRSLVVSVIILIISTGIASYVHAASPPLWPPPSLYILPVAVAGSTTAFIPSQDAPTHGAWASYAYKVGQTDNSYSIDIYPSSTAAIQASQAANQNGQPLITYTFTNPNPFHVWLYVEGSSHAVVAGAVVKNVAVEVVYYGPSGLQQSTDSRQWAPYAKRAYTILSALVSRTKHFHAPSDAIRNGAFIHFVRDVSTDSSQCRNDMSVALNADNAYVKDQASAANALQVINTALDACRSGQGSVTTELAKMSIALKPYASVAQIGIDWRSGMGAYEEALGLMASPLNGGATVPSQYITSAITSGVTSFVNAGNLTSQIRRQWHIG